ncbi:MAG: hypothetical protein E5W55_04140 [Mesorhizobium sp.]|nr:MAG: hypothetical protein E5W55_04140 [Mesorhizobium sp.]
MSEVEEYFRDKIARRVDYYMFVLDQMGDALPAQIVELASRMRDPLYVRYVREHGDPKEIRHKLKNILFHLIDMNDVIEADQGLEQFETDRSAMEQMLKAPFLRTGMKLRSAAKRGGAPRGQKDARNRLMAQEFLKRRQSAKMSDSALKADIGVKFGLQRSSAISAIDAGLENIVR